MSTLQGLLGVKDPQDYLERLIETNHSLAGNHFQSMVCLVIALRVKYQDSVVYDCNLNELSVREVLRLAANRGNADGCTDIRYKINDTLYMASCKFFEDDRKRKNIMKKYDLDMLNRECYELKIPPQNFVLWVRNKQEVLRKLAKCQSSVFREWVGSNIFGLEDLCSYWQIIQNTLQENNGDVSVFCKPKPLLLPSLRPHQRYAIEFARTAFQRGLREVLFAQIMRSGKTYMAGGYIALYKPNRVLIVTPQPTETFDQYAKDVLLEFAEFEEYNIITRFNSQSLDEINRDNVIIIDSKQTLDHNSYDTVLPFTLVILDENDLGGTTGRLDRSVARLLANDGNILYMTYTANKTIAYNQIPEEAIVRWDLEHINAMRLRSSADLAMLEEQFGERFTQLITEATPTALASYQTQPRLRFLMASGMSPVIETLLLKYQDTVYGFDFCTLFTLTSNNNDFKFPNDVNTFITAITGSNKVLMPAGDNSCFQRMRAMRGKTDTNKWFHTFYLPSRKGQKFSDVATVFQQYLQRDPNLKYYTILIIRGGKDKDVKQTIIQAYKNADIRGGLVVLTCRMLTRAISLPDLDSVFLLNNSRSWDLYIQTIFRVVTEKKGKEYGFVFDGNEKRVLSTVASFASLDKVLEGERYAKVKKFLANCITIDEGLFAPRENNALVEKVLTAYRTQALQFAVKIRHPAIMSIIDTIPDECLVLINASDKSSPKPTSAEMKVDDEADDLLDDLANGMVVEEGEELELVKPRHSSSSPSTIVCKNRDLELISLVRLVVLISQASENNDLLVLVQEITNDPVRTRSFQLILEARSPALVECNTIDLMLRLVHHTKMNELPTVMTLISQLRDDLQEGEITGAERYHEVFMEFVGKPGTTEVKSHGEVYTPLWLVNEMLDKLPVSVWSNPSLKWFEPACGLAPFLYLSYHRLMKGLEVVLPDESERRKHILEHMLYFNEVQEKNIVLVKLLFNADSYRLNIFAGDFFTVVPVDFDPDIVLGNPPYTSSLKEASTITLYNKFTERCISARYMLFITPSRWFVGGKGLDKFRRMMLQRRNLVLIKHEHNASKWFSSTVSIEGGVSYFFKNHEYNGDCCFNGVLYDLRKYECIVDPSHHSTIDKVKLLPSIASLYQGRAYGIETNDSRLKDSGSVKCYVSQAKSPNRVEYLTDFNIPADKQCWKVITARANGKKPCFGSMFVGRPDEVHTGSYISFRTASEEEAKSLVSYLQTPIVNYLLSLRKISQDISQNTCEWIPLVPLDRMWSNEEVCRLLKIRLPNEARVGIPCTERLLATLDGSGKGYRMYELLAFCSCAGLPICTEICDGKKVLMKSEELVEALLRVV